MPPVHSTTENILEYTVMAANALRDVATAQIPFIGTVCTITLTIIRMVQNTKFQKDRCFRIVEDIHRLLWALMNLSMHSEEIQSPNMLNDIAKYALILQKIDSCLRAQQDLGTIKRLFKQSELVTQLENCETELKGALDNFTVGRSVLSNKELGISSAIVEFKIDTEGRHQQLLELISTQSDSIDTVSSVRGGWERQVWQWQPCIAQKFLINTPLGISFPATLPRQMGVLVATIASHLGLDASRGSARHIAHHLTMQPPCLLVLDNFETPWEPVDGRPKVEELLALLADISHVGLLITMCGAERPSKVQWTRPFLPPLRPLSPTPAHQTFIEIADEIHDVLEVDQLLEITDNIPLAVQLVANVAASEGCQATLERWKIESTSLFSADGISDADLVQSKPPIPEILKCKAILVRTSLAYVDHAGRLKVLAPIRDYIQISRPPSPQLVQPLRKHLNSLLKLWRTPMSRVGNLAPHLLSNLGNMHNGLVYGLDCDQTDIEITIQAITILNQLNIQMHRGLTPLMSRLQEMLPQINDHQLCGQFIIETFRAKWFLAIPNPDKYMEEGIEHFHSVNNIEGEEYYADSVHDYNKAKKLYHCALTLALQCNSAWVQVEVLYGLGVIGYLHGAWSEALRLGCEVHKIAVAAGNVKGELAGLQCQARCYMGLGAFKHGMQMVNKAKELVLQAGMQGGSSDFDLMNLEGEVCYLKTEYAESRHIREIMLSHSSPILSPVNYAYTLVSLVALDLATGASTDIVLHNLHIAVDTFKCIHYPRGISLCDAHAADLSLRAGDKARARGQYIHTFTGAYDIDNELACSTALPGWQTLQIQCMLPQGLHNGQLSSLPLQCINHKKNMLAVHQALQSLGDVFAQQGMDAEALGILAAALEGFTWMDVHQSRAECMRTMGDVHFRCRQSSTACIFGQRLDLCLNGHYRQRQVSEIDSRLAKVKEEEEHHNTNVGYLSKLDVPTASLKQLPISEEEDVDVNIEMTGAQGVGMGV
ncbi:hypothetical protein B0H14DRAFT_3786346 [Mycena olivaceomarginata]|nr:hypothetical protein B0H14DRAFT_3786346 [Mycena olivaceomarginata]